MEQIILSVAEQVRKAMDGRTNRILALEIRMPESELSKKLKGHKDFTQDEIDAINARLKSKIKL
jgi:hypothetical protein